MARCVCHLLWVWHSASLLLWLFSASIPHQLLLFPWRALASIRSFICSATSFISVVMASCWHLLAAATSFCATSVVALLLFACSLPPALALASICLDSGHLSSSPLRPLDPLFLWLLLHFSFTACLLHFSFPPSPPPASLSSSPLSSRPPSRLLRPWARRGIRRPARPGSP